MIARTAMLLALPVALWGQETQKCSWSAERQTNIKSPSGQYNAFLGGSVVMRCPAKEVTLRSDSLESYADEGRVFVIGRVHYNEPRLDLDSDFLTYFQKDERIVAQGNVVARLPNGSTMRGPMAEYQRVIPGVRPVPRLLATGRPTITIVQKDSLGKSADTTTVLANNVTMVGDSLVYAGGSVLVTQREVTARGDSMALDSEREITVLMRGPAIEGRRDRPFTLSGDRIELMGHNRKLQRVVSKGRAKAVSEDMTLASDTIELRIADDLLQRTIAWGPPPLRARATSPTQQIVSDSIDAIMPAQKIREMHAVRTAVAEGKPDTIRFKADTVDWMRGDTIVARFDTVIARDTTRGAKLRELLAVGNARSYYHLPPSDSTIRKPAINYVTGREILVDFQNQRVAKVTVIDQAAGVYLEPKAEVPKADSVRAASPQGAPQPAAPPRRPPQ
jgi:lipopolysaccharide export system protein LptA